MREWDSTIVSRAGRPTPRNQREALSSCNSRSCQIVATGKRTCAAVAKTLTTGGSIRAVGYGTSTSVAEQGPPFE